MFAYELQKFGLDGITASERPQKQIKENEIAVKMEAASLNYHDFLTVLGLANPKVKMPLVPLSDGAGQVVEVGSNVQDFKVGDKVSSLFFPTWHSGRPTRKNLGVVTGETLDGCLQEIYSAPATHFIKAPAHLSAAEAATLPCAALTAWQSIVVDAKIKAGDTVLLQGTGGVSIFALQFAKLLGANVIITSSSDEKLEQAKALGADHCINYKNTEKWGKAAAELTDGEGVDLVVEVGGSGTFPQSLRAARIDGHVSVIGVLSGFSDVVSIAQIMGKNLTVKGITVGHKESFADMNAAIEYHQLKPVISTTLPFVKIKEGFELMQSGKHMGKICLQSEI